VTKGAAGRRNPPEGDQLPVAGDGDITNGAGGGNGGDDVEDRNGAPQQT
jgi:hypothetical protein